MRPVRFLPNTITAFGLACGLFVIFKVNMVEPGAGDYEMVHTSALLLMVAAIADFVDGALARAFRAESEFGFVFDTLADAISFGVAPSVLLLKTLSLEQGSTLSFISAAGAMVYSVCGVLRLVRYNVKKKEAEGNTALIQDQQKHFTGLPIPGAAAAAIAANLFLLSPWAEKVVALSSEGRAIFLSFAMVLLGYLMVCRLKFPSLKMLNMRLVSFHLAFLTVLVAISFLYGLIYFFPLLLVVIAWSYVIVALILAAIRLVAGAKSKTLQEFEPDVEDYES